LIAALVLVAGCKGILGIDDPALATIDAPVADAEIDAEPADARMCFGSLVEFCFDALPTEPRVFTGSTTLIGDDCTLQPEIGGKRYCVIAATTIEVATGATVRTSSSSLAPSDAQVVFVATQRIDVIGALDAWLLGPSPACSTGTAQGHSGGAGGSFGTIGGAGGANLGVATVPGTAVAAGTIRNGCPGGSGAPSGGDGGASGGAIALVAPTISLASTARLNASGYGGEGGRAPERGGGGGGSGGMILLDAEHIAIDAGAILVALGGGGGEGAGTNDGADGKRGTTSTAMTPPAGGSSNASNGGDGGDGAISSAGSNGDNGVFGNGAGGGGGGGTGQILLRAATIDNRGTIVPAPL